MDQIGLAAPPPPPMTPAIANFIDDEQKVNAFSYAVPALGLDGTYLFSYLGYFMSYITPHDITLVRTLDLVRDAFRSKITIEGFIFEALKIDSGFFGLIIAFSVISILPLFILLIWFCAKPSNEIPTRTVLDEDGIPTVDSLMAIDERTEPNLHCRRFLQFFLNILILIVISVIFMIISNEQVSNAINKTPSVIKSSLKDTEHFTRNSYKEIASNVHNGVSVAIDRIKVDLESIDTLLGEPIQKDLESDTGIKATLDSILGICSDSLSQAILISKEATQRTEEFRIQLAVLQRQCSGRDKPLCDTLRLRGFEDNGILNTFIRLQGDPNLLKMLSLGEYNNVHSHMNISTELKLVQQKFSDFPSDTKIGLANDIKHIEDLLTKMYENILSSTTKLTQTVNAFIERVDNGWDYVLPHFDNIREKSHVLWGFGLNASLTALVTTSVIYGAFWLGVSNEERAAKVSFVLGVLFISVASIGIAIFTAFIMLIGGYGELYVCRPLYDGPNYPVFSQFFDRPGVIYENETINGIIPDLLQIGNDTILINTTLVSAINKCERGDTTYNVFQIERLLNVSKVTDLENYDDLEDSIEKIFVSASTFATLTEPLEKIFEYMFNHSEINFSVYRAELSQPTRCSRFDKCTLHWFFN